MPSRISPDELIALVGTPRCPRIIDVRRRAAFEEAGNRIASAVWRNHLEVEAWFPRFRLDRPCVVYCAHGHNVSELAAASIAATGGSCKVLEGGIAAFIEAGGPIIAREGQGVVPGLAEANVWVTRERPKIDRIACPWLIRRFVDPGAVFHFVAAEWVVDVAAELGAIPFDVEGVFYSHRGDECTFDTILHEFGLAEQALLRLARIVQAADTGRLDLEPQAAGLLAISLGLSATETDDHEQLEKGMTIYDALYGWSRYATAEQHNWVGKR